MQRRGQSFDRAVVATLDGVLRLSGRRGDLRQRPALELVLAEDLRVVGPQLRQRDQQQLAPFELLQRRRIARRQALRDLLAAPAVPAAQRVAELEAAEP